jgi:hypothetical protein
MQEISAPILHRPWVRIKFWSSICKLGLYGDGEVVPEQMGLVNQPLEERDTESWSS